MRMHLPALRRRARSARAVAQASANPWKARWLELIVLAAAAATAAVCLTHVWPAPLALDPLLAVPPALAGVGAATVKRPLAYGAAALVAAVVVDVVVDLTASGGFAAARLVAVTGANVAHGVPIATIASVVVVTAVSATGTVVGARRKDTQQVQQEQQIADVTSVAEAAQRAVLRPLPESVGPLQLGVVYLAAAAEARVGGDLYAVAATEDYGVRLIIGDVRGKGLGAVEVAADIVGRFREVAHSVHTLDEVAYRLDAGLSRQWGEHEEFVTALLAQIDPERGRLTILTCGHPPPILISPNGDVTVLEVRAPAPPLGLLTLGNDSGAKETYPFMPNDQLLLYTDGVTEARDASREFYPLDQRVAALAKQALSMRKTTRAGRITKTAARQRATASANGSIPALLGLVRDDLLRHVGARPDDDAALLLVSAPPAWPGSRPGSRPATG